MPTKNKTKHPASTIVRALDVRPRGTDEHGERRLNRYADENGLVGWRTEHILSRGANYENTSRFVGHYDGSVIELGADFTKSRAAIDAYLRSRGIEPKPRLEDVADKMRFTRPSKYSVNLPWLHLEDWIERMSTEGKESGRLNLDPDFQRAHVWTREQQSAYVEYVLRGGYAARELYFNCTGWMGSYEGPFVIVDGKQRLEAVRAFLRNEVPVFGQLRSEYSSTDYIDADFRIYVNNLDTRREVLRWYCDLNTGGTPHTSEEIQRVRALLAAEERKQG